MISVDHHTFKCFSSSSVKIILGTQMKDHKSVQSLPFRFEYSFIRSSLFHEVIIQRCFDKKEKDVTTN